MTPGSRACGVCGVSCGISSIAMSDCCLALPTSGRQQFRLMNPKSLCPRSRQKSCVACAEGKRRCNRRIPQCSRCLDRGIPCVYTKGLSTLQGQRETGLQPFDPGYLENSSDISSVSPLIGSSLYDGLDNSPLLTISPSFFTIPWLELDTSYPEIAFLDRWSINQLERNIKSYPRMFARVQETPFIHPRLYETRLPDAIQDAFTVCAAYSTKSPETEDMISRILESKTAHLVQQHFESSSLEELLTAVQALMLMHIIQIFDGNIRQRSIAEQNFYTLQFWTIQLRARASGLGPALTWQEWIFGESVRRTVILSLLVNGLYSVLKFGYCTNVPALSLLPFTPGATLWHVTTSTAWSTESQCGKSNTLLYGDFSKAWESGQIPDKLDSFQKLLLTPCMGEKYREVLELED
jgi:hypothetical protein